MSRCRQTDALLEATFTGTGFTRAEADHAAGCSECAHALAQARRFDGELHRIGAELSAEPMPAAAELNGLSTPTQMGGWMMTGRRSLIGGALATIVVVGMIFGGGQWLGSTLEGRIPLGQPVAPGGGDLAEERLRRDAHLAARAAALAAAERRAHEVGGGGASCAEWTTMTDEEQLMITEVVVSDLGRVRIQQQLPADASVDEIIAGARASLDKGCQGSPANRAVADISRELYGGE